MIRKHKWAALISSLVIVLPSVAALFFKQLLPAEAASYWGVDGAAGGYGIGGWIFLLLPLLLLALHWLCLWITDKLQGQEPQSRKAEWLMFGLMPAVSVFVSVIMAITMYGRQSEPTAWLSVFCGLLLVTVGNLMPKLRQNYTIGIKVKWTLQSKENWYATHRFAGKVWVLLGCVVLLGTPLPDWLPLAVMAGCIVSAVILPFIYSYIYYRKEKQSENFVPQQESIRRYQKGKRIALVTVPLVLILVAVLLFVGEVSVQFDSQEFTADATFWSALTVEYDAVDSVEWRETLDRGTRVSGIGSARLLAGVFRNGEFGQYTLYSYTDCDAGVVVHAGDKILVIGGEDRQSTEQIYRQLLERCAIE